ncbi:hypothetical protein, partial [Streptomyces heilongjiangensis]
TPTEPEATPGDRPLAGPTPWTLSAATEAALRDQARRLLEHTAAHPDHTASDIGHSLATTRAALAHRAVVLADSHEDLLTRARALADGTDAPGVVTGTGTKAKT